VLRIARIARKRRNRPSLSFAGPSFEHKKDGFEFDEQTEAEVENPEAKQVIEQPAPVRVEEPAQKIAQVEQSKPKLPPLITDDRRLLPSNEAEAIILKGLQNTPGFPTRGVPLSPFTVSVPGTRC
jgi:hypothetical protein